ncbi:unnamed protein product [Gongylonema pulchrum]|uniref:Protein pangolin n=1 Tax=Gongylonema pulchrum TaxID=637853 RepID=A0A183EXG0_9BILA|nr:unnamed protein product [Gongylonema pulchrum]
MEEESVQSNEGEAEDHEEEEAAEETASEQCRTIKRKKGSKKGRWKKKKEVSSSIDPNTSSAEVCTMLGLTDVPNNFTEDDYNSITSAKGSCITLLLLLLMMTMMLFPSLLLLCILCTEVPAVSH